MAVIIKGKLISEKNPMVCVPIMERTAEEILAEAGRLVKAGVEMLEWRADAYEDLSDVAKAKEVLIKLREMTKEVILLLTIRSEAQGGLCEMWSTEIKNTLLSLSEVHGADIIDVEFFTFEKPERLIKRLQERGALVLSSHHDFDETPTYDVMKELLEQMKAGDADILKLAVMPKEKSDVLELLRITSDFHEEEPGIPLITMSMGRFGMISRLSGEIFGSCITFGAADTPSAPGQMPWKKTRDVLSFIHTYYGGPS